MTTPVNPNLQPATRPLRRTTGDLVATAVIAVLAIGAVGAATLTAPIRNVDSVVAAEAPDKDVPKLSELPAELSTVFHADTAPIKGMYRPVISAGRIIVPTAHGAIGYAPNGERAWSYERSDRALCSIGQAWGEAVLTFHNGMGCGDVVALDAATGNHAATRSALNADSVWAISSNDRVGTLADSRVELWRDDMVRTVEYGHVADPQEPDLQPHPECTLTSALTRTELLAVTEICPSEVSGQPEQAWLRLQDATPDDAREPEVSGSAKLPSTNARLMAVGQKAAAYYVPAEDSSDHARVVSVDKEGSTLATSEVPASSLLDGVEGAGAFIPATADLPHHMTFFDGQRLILLNPNNLKVTLVIEDVIGTGVAVGESVVVPTKAGLSVMDWDSGEVLSETPVDRGDYDGPVYLSLVGGTIVEHRGDDIVALAAAA